MTDSSSSLSFIQGFLLGQITIVLLIFAFIKFFIFGDIPDHSASRKRTLSTPSSSRLQPKKSTSALRPTPALSTASILSKTYYNVSAHQAESLDWFNVLIAQTIAQLRTDAQQDEAILTTLTNVLNGDSKPDFLDSIKVTEINLGEEFPIFSNCRIIPVEQQPQPSDGDGSPAGCIPAMLQNEAGPRLQARMDIDLSDNITLGIETKLLLNYPKPFVAVMPVALAVSVVRFSGTLSISFIPSPSVEQMNGTTNAAEAAKSAPPGATIPPSPTLLTFSFQPDYRLELSTRSLLGSRSRLQDVPKIAQIVEGRLHAWFNERCVEPKFQRVVLPSLWPRRRNVGMRTGSGPEASAPGTKEKESGKSPSHTTGSSAGEGELRNRRQRPHDRAVSDYHDEQQLHHLRLSEQVGDFELPGTMPGGLPR